MKLRVYIGIVLLVVLVGCTPPGPLSEGEGLPRPAATPSQRGTTSPRPSPGGEGEDSPALTGTPSQRGTASRALENIDSLMWWRADSALKVMMEFAGSPEADSLNEFEGHYCQVLVAELLYKNDYGQSNREEVLKAVGYFDSIVGMDGADIRGKADARGKADTRGVSLPFLDARAHPELTRGDLDYCCLYLLGLSDADVAALMQKAYPTVSHRARKMKAIYKSEAPLPTTLLDFAKESNG